MEQHSKPYRAVSAPFRKIFVGFTLFLLICLVAVVGYVAAGWSVADRIKLLSLPVLILAADMDYTPLEDKLIYLDEMPKTGVGKFDKRHLRAHIGEWVD